MDVKNIPKELFAGSAISMGFYCSLTTLAKTNNPFLSAFMFYVGLALILITKSRLFTGCIYTLHSQNNYIHHLFQIYIFNFIGAIVTTLLLFTSVGVLDISNIILQRINSNPIYLILGGIITNILVCSSVYSYKNNNLFYSCLFIMSFVLIGTPHIVADFSSMTFGLYQGLCSIYEYITVIISVTIGNVIGGLLFYRIINH